MDDVVALVGNRALSFEAIQVPHLDSRVPSQVEADTAVETDLRFTSLSAGFAHTCGIAQDDRLWCWGRNEYGQLGDGSNASGATPVAVASGDESFTGISLPSSSTVLWSGLRTRVR